MTKSAAHALSQPAAAELLHREALCLDEQRWDEWLGLFHPQAEFWVPAWKSEHQPTEDPLNEVSLIYLSSRTQLGERVTRVRSRRSAASTPLPRTAHAVSNVMVLGTGTEDSTTVLAVAVTHLFDVKRRESHTLFGRSEYRLTHTDGDWQIRRKKVVLLNDYLPTVVDFYSI